MEKAFKWTKKREFKKSSKLASYHHPKRDSLENTLPFTRQIKATFIKTYTIPS